jgi:hypothetical protein
MFKVEKGLSVSSKMDKILCLYTRVQICWVNLSRGYFFGNMIDLYSGFFYVKIGMPLKLFWILIKDLQIGKILLFSTLFIVYFKGEF